MSQPCSDCGRPTRSVLGVCTRESCKAPYARAHYATNRDRIQERYRERYASGHRLRQQERRRANPDEYRYRQLKCKYGLSRKQFDAMWRQQGGLCYACKRALELRKHGFAIDHNHNCCPGAKSCGKCVRGLLCGPCNSALGYAQDSPDVLRALANYVETHALEVAA
jgi:hypothetical protein